MIGVAITLYIKKRDGNGPAVAHQSTQGQSGRPEMVDKETQVLFDDGGYMWIPRYQCHVVPNDAAKSFRKLHFTRSGTHAHLFARCPNQPDIPMAYDYDLCKYCEKEVAAVVGTPGYEVQAWGRRNPVYG